MSGQNRFLLPPSLAGKSASSPNTQAINNDDNPTIVCSVDADFDSYWEEEARNPHRNRIRIGRQYQATVPPLLKPGESDKRKLDDLETLRFCPKKSAHLSKAELDHYFNVANSMNLFASLVETRCLLGKDVTIADLNHIRHKEGLSLASVIQPHPPVSSSSHQSLTVPTNGVRPTSPNQTTLNSSTTSPSSKSNTFASSKSSQAQQSTQQQNQQQSKNVSATNSPSSNGQQSTDKETSRFKINPLIKALSHFISLHHPVDRESGCKKSVTDESPNDENRQSEQAAISPPKEVKMSRSRLARNNSSTAKLDAAKQQAALTCEDVTSQSTNASNDWTREEIELFTKALEICGKNFGLIKKEFFPSKSVRSIVEHYYIGTKELIDTKRKTPPNIADTDACGTLEKAPNNRNGGGGSGNGGSSGGGSGSGTSNSTLTSCNRLSSNTSNTTSGSQSSKSGSGASSNGSTKRASTDDAKISPINSNKTKDVKIPKDAKIHGTSNKSKGHLAEHKLSTGLSSSSTLVDDIKPKVEEDPRLSVYSFDNCNDEPDTVPTSAAGNVGGTFLPRSVLGSEVKALKAKPIIPNANNDTGAAMSSLGSLKFYMDGQLVLKLNAQQDQMAGNEKCQWVQSQDVKLNGVTRNNRKATKRKCSNQPQSLQVGNQPVETVLDNHSNSMSNSVLSSRDSSSDDDDSRDTPSSQHGGQTSSLTSSAKKSRIKTEPRQQRSNSQPPLVIPRQATFPPPLPQVGFNEINNRSPNDILPPWSNAGFAAALNNAAALFLSQNAQELTNQDEVIKSANHNLLDSFIRSPADLMMLNPRNAAAVMQSSPANEYMPPELSGDRGITRANRTNSSKSLNSNRVRTSPTNNPGISNSDQSGGVQRPPRAHSTSSSTSSSSGSTLPFTGSIPSNNSACNYTSPVTPSPSPADHSFCLAGVNQNERNYCHNNGVVDLSLDTSSDIRNHNDSVKNLSTDRKLTKGRASKTSAAVTNTNGTNGARVSPYLK